MVRKIVSFAFLIFWFSVIIFTGIRIILEFSLRDCNIDCLIHHTAYDINLNPFVWSNLCAAVINPALPSDIKSSRSNPAFWYCFAIEITNLRFAFTNLFKDSGIRRDLYTLRDRWYDEEDDYGLMYTNRAGSLGSNFPTPKRGACYYPHYTIFIDWDGEILLCCHDMYNKTETFGNVNDLPLLELWKNQRLTHFRKKLKNGDRSESPCNNCSANGVVLGKFHAEKW